MLIVINLVVCNCKYKTTKTPVGNIREYDFENSIFTFPENAGHPVSSCLKSLGKSFRLNTGGYEILPDSPSGMGGLFKITRIEYADLDNDGLDEAALLFSCEPGGSAIENDLIVYKLTNGIPLPVISAGSGDRAYGGIFDFKMADGSIQIIRFQSNDGPLCCPTFCERKIFKLSRGQLILQGHPERLRFDTQSNRCEGTP